MVSPLSLLLDTHVLLWWLAGSSRLRLPARAAIAESPSVYVSAATAWEIAIKSSLGKLDFPRSLEQQLLQNQFHPLPISIPHAMAVATLPLHHRDPFGRMLVAQARIESLTLVTSDPILRAYDVTTLLV